jgi:hypothetical protein
MKTLLQDLARLYAAEEQALLQDPDGRCRRKNGWREHQPDMSGYRALTAAELHEVDRLRALSVRCCYASMVEATCRT